MNLEEQVADLKRQVRRLRITLFSMIAVFILGTISVGACLTIGAHLERQAAMRELAKARQAAAKAQMERLEAVQAEKD